MKLFKFFTIFAAITMFYPAYLKAENYAGTSAPQSETNEIDDSFVQNILKSNDTKALEDLIAAGLDVNSRDDKGDTMLYYTLVNNDNLLMARKLIDAGADVNAPSSSGMTPILVATSKANELQLQKMMLNTMDFEEQKEIVNARISEEIEYEMNRAIAMLQMLIEQGADVNQETPLGTPLMSAATSDWNLDIIEILLKNGAKVNQQDKNGRTAMFYAQVFDCQEVMTLLLKAGADINIRDNNGKTYMDVEASNFIEKN